MKKYVLLMLAVLCVEMAQAQLSDTVRHRNRNYYYSHWYDTCNCMYNGTDPVTDPAQLHLYEIHAFTWQEFAKADYTPRPLELLGVAVMVDPSGFDNFHRYIDTNYGEEYVYVAYYDSANNQMLRLDSARWDTLQPKTMELVLTETPENYKQGFECPPGGVAYCRVYEAYFEKPVEVEGEFFLMGSLHGSALCEEPGWEGWCLHRPVRYVMVRGWPTNCTCCFPTLRQFRNSSYAGWLDLASRGTGDGPFLPIITPQSLLEVHSADSVMGHVTGGGFYMDSVNAQIEAVPEYGYVFSHWNDGDTANPRHVTVTCDTSFTAYFAEATYYRLATNAYPPEYGTVTGGGYYPENTDTVITAQPVGEQYRFLEWHDHDTANPRRVRVERDTMFTAVFEAVADTGGQQQGIGGAAMAGGQFRLVPNPATEEVRCLTAGEEFDSGVLKVVDAAGREVLRRELPRQTQAYTFRVADYPSGTYFVTLTTAKGTSTQKLVVEN